MSCKAFSNYHALQKKQKWTQVSQMMLMHADKTVRIFLNHYLCHPFNQRYRPASHSSVSLSPSISLRTCLVERSERKRASQFCSFKIPVVLLKGKNFIYKEFTTVTIMFKGHQDGKYGHTDTGILPGFTIGEGIGDQTAGNR